MSVVEQIKERLNIVDIIGFYVKLEKTGINYKGRCPFHNEKTPSFFVSSSRQSFYCFGCGEKGDIFSFIQKFDGLNFKESLKVLGEKAGVDISNSNFGEDNLKDEKQKLYQILEEATLFFEDNLEKNVDSKKYLEKRGLRKEDIKKWRIGYAKDEWRTLYQVLLNKKYSQKDMMSAGLIKEKDGKYYDTFRSRIIFPILDSNSKVIAFSGRLFPEKEGNPKYLNSPETPVFHKSEILYGWNFAKNEIRRLDYAVLVEGQMDLLMSHQAQTQNTVASSGTALTIDHLNKIKKLTNRIIIAYDSDNAGEKAAQRASELALGIDLEVKIAVLPEGEDPASLILKKKEDWKNALTKSQHLIDFCLNKISKNKKGTALLKEVEKTVLPYVNFIKSDVERSHFIRKIAQKIEVSEESIVRGCAKIKQDNYTDNKNIDSNDTKNKYDLNRVLTSLYFLKQDNYLLKRWIEIVGNEEVDNTLKTYEKERDKMIFEAEEFGEIEDSVLNRIELNTLREKLRKKSIELDNFEGKNDKLEKEIVQISKKIMELSKNN